VSDETKEVKRTAKAAMIKLQHVAKADWTLSIEGVDYPVVAGAVEVPEYHVPAAKQAGFREVT